MKVYVEKLPDNCAEWNCPFNYDICRCRYKEFVDVGDRIFVEILDVDGKVVDEVSTTCGVRYFSFDPDKGFFLNGRPYNLHGVSRHRKNY